MAEIFFETFNVEGLYIGVQAVLALYAGVATKHKSDNTELKPEDLTGLVVDSGDGVTHIVPVVDSYVLGTCIRHIPRAGRDITKFILQAMQDRGETFPTEDRIMLAQRVKEKYGYICEGDLVKEFAKYDTKQVKRGKILQSPEFQHYETIGAATRTVRCPKY